MPTEGPRRLASGMVHSAGPLVLCVEDAPDIRSLYATYLRRAGYRVAEAGNGVEGVERAIELQPSVILMDLQLPFCDGYEATRRIKRHPRTKHIPVIVVSAYGYQAQLREAAACHCDDYLVKPVAGSDLVAAVMRAVEATADPAASNRSGRTAG